MLPRGLQLKILNLTISQLITVYPQGITSFCCSQPHHHHLLCLSESEENVHHHHTFTVSVSMSEHKILMWIFTVYKSKRISVCLSVWLEGRRPSRKSKSKQRQTVDTGVSTGSSNTNWLLLPVLQCGALQKPAGPAETPAEVMEQWRRACRHFLRL